jgi:hypothetical protein
LRWSTVLSLLLCFLHWKHYLLIEEVNRTELFAVFWHWKHYLLFLQNRLPYWGGQQYWAFIYFWHWKHYLLFLQKQATLLRRSTVLSFLLCFDIENIIYYFYQNKLPYWGGQLYWAFSCFWQCKHYIHFYQTSYPIEEVNSTEPSSIFDIENIIYFYTKTSYPNEEVICTEPSPSASIPWNEYRSEGVNLPVTIFYRLSAITNSTHT